MTKKHLVRLIDRIGFTKDIEMEGSLPKFIYHVVENLPVERIVNDEIVATNDGVEFIDFFNAQEKTNDNFHIYRQLEE